MSNWWRDLSVSKKLYAVVGVMAMLIATELLTLLFAMDVLSAVRSFVGGEGLWSKAQKDAIHSLQRFAFTKDPKHFDAFHNHLQINMGDRAARLELMKPEPDLEAVATGFIQGGNHPEDVPGLIHLIQRFYWVNHLDQALSIWAQADMMIDELMEAGAKLDEVIRTTPANLERIDRQLVAIDELNERLTRVEIQFSEVLGAGSRWLEHVLMLVLFLAVLMVETTGVVLTILFSRNLNRTLTELTKTAEEVGQGNFSVVAPVRSQDELGQLAESINKMTADLKNSAGKRAKAESASLEKSRFLAHMSHEIRTPLGVMLGLTEILKDPKLTWQEQMRYVETIERTGKNLSRIINDILDLSKVEAGHMGIETSEILIGEFMADLRAMLSVQAAKTGNKLRIAGHGELPEAITTDRTRLRQILVNLVNNSLKFTTNGEVNLTYRAEGSLLIFDVEDNGRGIGDADREKIFEAFTRAENQSAEDKKEGTGLGLMLSKRLARALGGDVVLVHSSPGKGSLFRATISYRPALHPPKPHFVSEITPQMEPVVAPLSGRKVLVVEDSEDNQLLVKLFLTRMGMKVEFADNGKEGFERAQEKDFDVVLMDMQMPVMDGYSATKALRDAGYKKPIIALTAHAMKEDRTRCISVGCTDYLTKPVDSKALAETIARHLKEGYIELQI